MKVGHAHGKPWRPVGNKLEIKIAGGVEGTHAVILSLVARQAELNSSCYSVRFKSGLFSKAS